MERLKLAWEKFLNTDYAQILREYWGLDDWVALAILGLGIYYFWASIPENPPQKILQIYQAIHSEMIGIGITVLILGNAGQYLRKKAEKSRLILQMGSPDNSFAIEAVRQLRAKGWLYDGTTKGAYLWGADLWRAILYWAHLEGANLMKANLEEAYLLEAHLEGANLRGASYDNDTDWVDTKYTEGENGTEWPDEDFGPEAKGCILVENKPDG